MHGCHDHPMKTHQAKDEELHKWKGAFFSKSNWPLCLSSAEQFSTQSLAFVFTHAGAYMDTDHMFTLYASFLHFWWEAEGWGCFKVVFSSLLLCDTEVGKIWKWVQYGTSSTNIYFTLIKKQQRQRDEHSRGKMASMSREAEPTSALINRHMRCCLKPDTFRRPWWPL